MADGTVGNSPTSSNPAGVTVETAPVQDPGWFGNYPNPGMAETADRIAEGVASTAAAAVTWMQQSHAFITENGAEVLGGHSPVNAAPGQVAGETSGDIFDAGS